LNVAESDAEGQGRFRKFIDRLSELGIQLGLVASLGRPGGNVTGVTSLNVEVAPKRLELLCELTIHADQTRLRQSLLNLASNANKFTEYRQASTVTGPMCGSSLVGGTRRFGSAHCARQEALSRMVARLVMELQSSI
jgi:hypothetical protein